MIQSLRNILTTILVFGVFLTGCESVSNVKINAAGAEEYTGVEIFNGLLFGEGKVAKLFPEVWSNPEVVANRNATSKKDMRDIDNARKDFIKFIKHQDPKFFGEFAPLMQSGDPYEVDKAVNDLYDLVIKFGNELEQSDATLAPQQACGPSAFCGVVAFVAVVVGNYVLVAHSIVAGLAIFVVVGAPGGKSIQSQAAGADLAEDMYIAEVTSRLHYQTP